MSLDDVEKFFIDFIEAEYQAEQAKQLEPDLKKFMQLVWKNDAMFELPLASGISRPEGDPAEYSSAENIAYARALHRRSLFAVARFEGTRKKLYCGWLGDDQDGKFGEGMSYVYYVTPIEGALKIVTRNWVCAGCMGSGIREEGGCFYCGTKGWEWHGGKKITKTGTIVELRKFKPPTDHRYLAAYEKIQLP